MRPRLLDAKIKHRFRRYAAQVSLAALSLFGVLWAEQLIAGPAVARAVIIGAIAATAFILFLSPHRDVAAPRHVLGGHSLAIVIAGALALVMGNRWGIEWTTLYPVLFPILAAVGVGVAMFVMAATDTEHPPAAGTALAIAAHGFNWQIIIFIAGSVLVMAAVQRLVRSRLMDLY